ncbi:Adenylate kinase [Colwellia chukchiensis]|uniref:Adenylate kinase n=1 Tax=Colwellia chukchiensis TaxID=641665 RepID=A0A1H7KM01_9GAMM|nr:AAA family ATPase [Colwellia chukchiensis]SEK87574.1 Adenylate kinase [Colwellia chukchiensis]
MQARTEKRLVIFGNSAAGKSTLAQQLATRYQLAHLDLDTLAWLAASGASTAPQRQAIEISVAQINDFIDQHTVWVIEGCYSDLLSHTLAFANEVLFLNIPLELCIANAKKRPWEPHKYKSKAAQDANLAMLIDWIAQYDTRSDSFSKAAHQQLYAQFSGHKHQLTDNQASMNFVR